MQKKHIEAKLCKKRDEKKTSLRASRLILGKNNNNNIGTLSSSKVIIILLCFISTPADYYTSVIHFNRSFILFLCQVNS